MRHYIKPHTDPNCNPLPTTLYLSMALVLLHLLLLAFSFSGASATDFNLHNSCPYTVWAGIEAGTGKPMIGNGGVRLDTGRSALIPAPTGWSGRIWPRRGCTFDTAGRGGCQTGDCRGLLACDGSGGVPPVTLAEFTLDSPVDYYDISLVDGYNAQISVTPTNKSCEVVKCQSDLNRSCPTALQVVGEGGEVVACRSACLAFGTPEYCCTGAYASPAACRPTAYSRVFKDACPTAYSYAYDDPTSIFTCHGSDYLITFC